MTTWSTVSEVQTPCEQSSASPAKPPLSSSTVALCSTLPRRRIPARRMASTAKIDAAIPAFWSPLPRP